MKVKQKLSRKNVLLEERKREKKRIKMKKNKL